MFLSVALWFCGVLEFGVMDGFGAISSSFASSYLVARKRVVLAWGGGTSLKQQSINSYRHCHFLCVLFPCAAKSIFPSFSSSYAHGILCLRAAIFVHGAAACRLLYGGLKHVGKKNETGGSG